MPRESHGQRSLAGSSPWGHRESDTTGAIEQQFGGQCLRQPPVTPTSGIHALVEGFLLPSVDRNKWLASNTQTQQKQQGVTPEARFSKDCGFVSGALTLSWAVCSPEAMLRSALQRGPWEPASESTCPGLPTATGAAWKQSPPGPLSHDLRPVQLLDCSLMRGPELEQARLRVGGEGGDRGRDGWMASPTRWT